MEYTQITLNDWMEMKQKLKLELQGVKQSFVRIGYLLRRIDDSRAYESDGYKSIAEFARAEYGLEASTVSRFMSINRAYSVDGYSERLKEEYLGLGRSQLEEMLKLPEEDRQMIEPQASREDIRQLKRFNREMPEAGAEDLHSLIEQFYKQNKEILNELCASDAYAFGETGKMAEIVNPGGNRSFHKGLYFLMMYEESIKVKKFGETPVTMSWEKFFEITKEIFAETAAGADTYRNHFGAEPEKIKEEPEKAGKPVNDKGEEQARETKEADRRQDMGKITEPEEKTEEGKIAPAQKNQEISGVSNKKETVKVEVFPGIEAEITDIKKAEEAVRENILKGEIEATPGHTKEEVPMVEGTPLSTSRKEYMSALTAYGMAEYMAKAFRKGEAPKEVNLPVPWEAWLLEPVDKQGMTIK